MHCWLKNEWMSVWFFFLTCKGPLLASGNLERPLIFSRFRGHFDKMGATLVKFGPFWIKNVQNVPKIVTFNVNFDKLGVKFVNFGQKIKGHTFNFP